VRLAFPLLLMTLLLLPALPAAEAPPSRFAVSDLGAISRLDGSVGALALNDRGQVVGGDDHALLWDNGSRQDMGVLPPSPPVDDASSTAYGINNRGQIVGSSGGFSPIFMSGLQFEHGFLFQSHAMRQLTGEGASFEPHAINDRGAIVGLDQRRGFFYASGSLIILETLSKLPAGNYGVASGINASGQIVGASTASVRGQSGLATHAFLWQRGGKSGRMRDLGTLPGCVNSSASGINRRGEVAGTATDTAGKSQAFLWCRGRMTGLGVLPGSESSEAYGINNVGAVVGQSDGRAFLWRSGTMRDLNALVPAGTGWALSEARAINNKGQIAGNGTLNGQPHAFLLTPR